METIALPELLKAGRMRKGLSQQEVAAKAGVSQKAISDTEKGKVSEEMLLKLAKIYGIDWSELLQAKIQSGRSLDLSKEERELVEAATQVIDRVFGPGKIRMIEFNDLKIMQAEIDIDQNVTLDWMRTDFTAKTMEACKQMAAEPMLNDAMMLCFYPMIDFKDRYGNASHERCGRLKIKSGTLRKINWQGMNYESFARLLSTEGDYWWHPSMLK